MKLGNWQAACLNDIAMNSVIIFLEYCFALSLGRDHFSFHNLEIMFMLETKKIIVIRQYLDLLASNFICTSLTVMFSCSDT